MNLINFNEYTLNIIVIYIVIFKIMLILVYDFSLNGEKTAIKLIFSLLSSVSVSMSSPKFKYLVCKFLFFFKLSLKLRKRVVGEGLSLSKNNELSR